MAQILSRCFTLNSEKNNLKKITAFFWLCSGASRTLLRNCPTESSKYAGIGATVFFTGIFAAIASAYALYTVFENIIFAMLFGVVWGLMIFNLDRYIVSSMRKQGNFRKEFTMAIPRLILAILISIVIVKPLELKVFEKEINSELELMEKLSLTQKVEVIKTRFTAEKEQLQREIDSYKLEINQKTDSRNALRQQAQQEADGTGGSMRRNAGPIYQLKKADADKVDQELAELMARNSALISEKQNRLKEIEVQVEKEILALERNRMAGPAARMDALSNLTGKSKAIWLANWFIVLLFIAVETAPVLVKLLSPRGPYDDLLAVEERKFETASYEQFADQNMEIKARTANHPEFEKEYLERVLNRGMTSG